MRYAAPLERLCIAGAGRDEKVGERPRLKARTVRQKDGQVGYIFTFVCERHKLPTWDACSLLPTLVSASSGNTHLYSSERERRGRLEKIQH